MSYDTTEGFVSQEIRTIASIKAARAALGWTQAVLAKRAGISVVSLARLEAGLSSARLSTLAKIKGAFEAFGVRVADDYPPGGFTLTVAPRALQSHAPDGNLVGPPPQGE